MTLDRATIVQKPLSFDVSVMGGFLGFEQAKVGIATFDLNPRPKVFLVVNGNAKKARFAVLLRNVFVLGVQGIGRLTQIFKPVVKTDAVNVVNRLRPIAVLKRPNEAVDPQQPVGASPQLQVPVAASSTDWRATRNSAPATCGPAPKQLAVCVKKELVQFFNAGRSLFHRSILLIR